MIDTIKFNVPINNHDILEKLKTVFVELKREDKKTKDIKFAYYSLDLFLGKYKKKIIVKIEEKYSHGLSVEFSIPKYHKGNSIEMIWPRELDEIIRTFYEELCFHLGIALPHFTTWEIQKLDVCYNWIFTTKQEAETVMSFLQRIDFPRKKKYSYVTSVMYKGTAYTLKFYLKGDEFKAHDLKDKDFQNNHTLNEIFELGEWADRIVRYEVAFRKKYFIKLFGKKLITLEDIRDDKQIEDILSFYLKEKVFKYVTLRNTTDAQLEEILYSNFTKIKALRLFQFYRDYYFGDGAVKNRMITGGLNRSTIWRYKTDLKRVGIGFNFVDKAGESLLAKLVIPSESSRFDLVDASERKPEGDDSQEVV